MTAHELVHNPRIRFFPAFARVPWWWPGIGALALTGHSGSHLITATGDHFVTSTGEQLLKV